MQCGDSDGQQAQASRSTLARRAAMIATAPLHTRMKSIVNRNAAENLEDPLPADSALVEILNNLDGGLLLVDSSGQVCFVNDQAKAMIQARQLRVLGGQLCARSCGETVSLHRVVADSARINGGGPANRALCHRLGDLLVRFVPLSEEASASAGTPGRLVAIFVVDPTRFDDPDPRHIKALLGLTDTEAQFACAIATGEGLKTSAKKFGISESTARTHLHRIFEKTGTKRQAQLVRLLLATRFGVRRS